MENAVLEETIISVQDFICRVTDKDAPKAPEEVAILPEIIRAFTGLIALKSELTKKKG